MKDFFKKFKSDFNYICVLAIVFSALGWIVENTFRVIANGKIDNRFHILPFIPVYGFIAFAVYILGSPDDEKFFGYKLTKNKVLSNIIYILTLAFFVTFGELIVGNTIEYLCGAKLWNYNNIPLHWTRYTSLPTTLGFSVGGYLILKVFYYPILNYLKENFTSKQLFGAPVFYAILLSDMIYMLVITGIKGKGQVYWQVNLRNGDISILTIIDIVIFAIFNFYLILFIIANLRYFNRKKKTIAKKDEKSCFALLLYERDDKSLEETISSINKVDYPLDKLDLYIISKDNISKDIKFNHKVILNTNQFEMYNKGIEEIYKTNKKYDYIVVLSSTDIVDVNYFLRMSDAALEGYDVVVGNKNNTNYKSGIASSIKIMEISLNYINDSKNYLDEANILYDSGYAIKYSVIEKEGKWPFNGGVVDSEIINYVRANKLKSCYQHKAIFYSVYEPKNIKEFVSYNTMRLEKEFIVKSKKQKKTFTSTITYGLVLHFVFFIVYNLLLTIFGLFVGINSKETLMYTIISLVAYYVLMFLFALTVLLLNKKERGSQKGILKEALFHPIFLSLYFLSYAKAYFKYKKTKKNISNS